MSDAAMAILLYVVACWLGWFMWWPGKKRRLEEEREEKGDEQRF